MAPSFDPLPEPLRSFQGLAGTLAAELRDVEEAFARYREERDEGGY
jgi:hypothetical protein